jgi:hypothetical protein
MDRPIRTQLAQGGFVVRVLAAPGVAYYVAQLRALDGPVEPWAEPDGVNRHPEFRSVIFNERLLATG